MWNRVAGKQVLLADTASIQWPDQIALPQLKWPAMTSAFGALVGAQLR
jgi:hypothetical protein